MDYKKEIIAMLGKNWQWKIYQDDLWFCKTFLQIIKYKKYSSLETIGYPVDSFFFCVKGGIDMG